MSVLLPRKPSRRSVLRGAMGGAGLSVALPFLDCFLDSKGTALAATGAPLPVRFGTWFWGLGLTPGYAVKDKPTTGPGITFLEQCKALERFADDLNFFSGFNMPLDGRSNYVHITGWIASRCGTAPSSPADLAAPTLDLLVADAISGGSRFQTIDLSACNEARENYSARSANNRGAAEVSPVALYARLFGPDFVDPNVADFKPDPKVMVHKSVLSFVGDDSKAFNNALGASDKARLDEYFTSIRQLENQLALQLEKPEHNAACSKPLRPTDIAGEGLEIETAQTTHKVMAKLLAVAVACNQTKVFNMTYSDNQSHLRKPGESAYHHILTHEEAPDPVHGYQPESHWFGTKSMDALAAFIEAFATVREGAGTLLDNTLIFASTESYFARTHTLDGVPLFFAGKGGGRMKTGMHVVGNGDPITRVGLTAMQAMGVSIDKWGTQSLQTSKSISDILV